MAAKDGAAVTEGERLEQLICSLGEFSRYQCYVFFLACTGSFMAAMLIVAMPFLAYEPPHRCRVVECEGTEPSMYNQSFLPYTTPYDGEHERWSQCDRFTFNETFRGNSTEENCFPDYFENNQLQKCKDGYIFDPSVFRSTVITDFDLWCSSPWLISLAGMVYMIGMLVGAILMGLLADRIGRRNTMVVTVAILGITGAVGAASNSYYMFLVARALSGVGTVGLFEMSFILCVEFIGTKYRSFVGIMIEVPFALGEATAGVLAYFIRDWRYLQATVTVPALLMVSYIWIMPESVRWLVSRGRTEEAIKVLNNIAKASNKTIPEESLAFLKTARTKNKKIDTPADGDVALNELGEGSGSSDSSNNSEKTFLDLLRTPNMRVRSICMFICWASVTFMYYGLSLNSSNLGANIFLSFILTMLIEIPSYVFAWIVIDKLGRKGTLMFTFLLGGMSCVIAGILSQDQVVAKMVLSLIGKFGASAAFAVVYVYATEIFPTEYRGIGVGACSTFARAGGILAPLFVELFKKTPAVAPIIFGVIGLVCGLLVISLPETTGAVLPQTVEESETFGLDQRRLDCCHCLTVRRNRRLQT